MPHRLSAAAYDRKKLAKAANTKISSSELPPEQPSSTELPCKQPTPLHYFPMLLTPAEVFQVQEFISCLVYRRTMGHSELPCEQPQPDIVEPQSSTDIPIQRSSHDEASHLETTHTSELGSPELPMGQLLCCELPCKQPCAEPPCPQHFDIAADDEVEAQSFALSDTSILAQLDSGDWLAPLPDVPAFPFAAEESETSSATPSCEQISHNELPAEQPLYTQPTDSEPCVLGPGPWADLFVFGPEPVIYDNQRNEIIELPSEQPSDTIPNEQPPTAELSLLALSAKVLSTPFSDLPFRDAPLTVYQKLKALGLTNVGEDSIFEICKALKFCSSHSQIASALRDLFKDGLIAFTGAASSISVNCVHPTYSTSELVNPASSLQSAPALGDRDTRTRNMVHT